MLIFDVFVRSVFWLKTRSHIVEVKFVNGEIVLDLVTLVLFPMKSLKSIWFWATSKVCSANVALVFAVDDVALNFHVHVFPAMLLFVTILLVRNVKFPQLVQLV